jgi:hypothetical protein
LKFRIPENTSKPPFGQERLTTFGNYPTNYRLKQPVRKGIMRYHDKHCRYSENVPPREASGHGGNMV